MATTCAMVRSYQATRTLSTPHCKQHRATMLRVSCGSAWLRLGHTPHYAYPAYPAFAAFHFFMDAPTPGTPRHVCHSFHANIGSSDGVRRAIIKIHLTSKVDIMLKPINYKATTQITRVFRAKVQMSAPFFGDRSWLIAYVSYSTSPFKAVDEWGYLVFTGRFGSFKTQKSPKNVGKRTYLAGKKTYGSGRTS